MKKLTILTAVLFATGCAMNGGGGDNDGNHSQNWSNSPFYNPDCDCEMSYRIDNNGDLILNNGDGKTTNLSEADRQFSLDKSVVRNYQTTATHGEVVRSYDLNGSTLSNHYYNNTYLNQGTGYAYHAFNASGNSDQPDERDVRSGETIVEAQVRAVAELAANQGNVYTGVATANKIYAYNDGAYHYQYIDSGIGVAQLSYNGLANTAYVRMGGFDNPEFDYEGNVMYVVNSINGQRYLGAVPSQTVSTTNGGTSNVGGTTIVINRDFSVKK
ncbi:MAG: hypothetical protein LBJ18_00380 [Rickettsiales bacterium]|jgi:hypothetical protein|nr:hypothetical protein [Rickettsiales bacterium]